MEVKTLIEALKWASSFLKEHLREEHVAKVLLFHHFKLNEHTFVMQTHESIDQDKWKAYQAHIIEHAKTGKPVQHLIGEAPFYGRDFLVNEDVLIPRFDTEILVHHIIECVQNKEEVTVVDVGTGSGIIAITLASELENAQIYATDISKAALNVAKKNANKYDVAVKFIETNYLQALIEQNIYPDIVVSNPPYIEKANEGDLDDTVRLYDPPLALYGGESGLEAYEAIVEQLKVWPKDFYLAFEIGYKQGHAVSQLIKDSLLAESVGVIQDFNGHDRVVYAHIKKKD